MSQLDEKPGIYRIVNKVTMECYVGMSRDVKKRWKSHRSNLRGNRHHCKLLQQSWQTYGEANFVVEVLESLPSTLSSDEVEDREIWWIEHLKPEYNPSIPSPDGLREARAYRRWCQDQPIAALADYIYTHLSPTRRKVLSTLTHEQIQELARLLKDKCL